MARVIKADDVKTVGAQKAAVLNLRDLAAQAQQIVLDARKEAAAVKARAREEARSIREEAAAAGHAQGLEQGRSEGYAQGAQRACDDNATNQSAQVDEVCDVLRQIVEELSAVKADAMHRMRQELLDLALELAAKVVGEVAVRDVSAGCANLEKVLAMAGRSGDIVVKVSPPQLRRLEKHCEELLETMSLRQTVTLVADESITPGGVKLLLGKGEIDATIQTQLANLAQSLVGGAGMLFDAPGLNSQSGSARQCAGGTFITDAATSVPLAPAAVEGNA